MSPAQDPEQGSGRLGPEPQVLPIPSTTLSCRFDLKIVPFKNAQTIKK